jgi:hypothetical protein
VTKLAASDHPADSRVARKRLASRRGESGFTRQGTLSLAEWLVPVAREAEAPSIGVRLCLQTALQPRNEGPPVGLKGVCRPHRFVSSRSLVGSARFDRTAATYGGGGRTGREPIATWVSVDLTCIVDLERHETHFGETAESVTFVYRTTHVLRREDGSWKVVLRHADPRLTKSRSRPSCSPPTTGRVGPSQGTEHRSGKRLGSVSPPSKARRS